MSNAAIRLSIAAAIVVAALAGVTARQAPAAKKAYFIAEVEVTNAQQYGEYAKLSPGVIEKFGGRFVARGGRVASSSSSFPASSAPRRSTTPPSTRRFGSCASARRRFAACWWKDCRAR
jgi:hypothetical protein